jgi:hypothetical protein
VKFSMSKKCSKCNKEMRKGVYIRGIWVEGAPGIGLGVIKISFVGRKTAKASCYACFSCNNIEFSLEGKD